MSIINTGDMFYLQDQELRFQQKQKLNIKLTLRKQASNKPISPEILGMKRGQLINHLQPKFGDIPLDEITQVMYEDWRLTLPLANSTKNDITVVINQIMKEAVRDEKIKTNPIQNVESLSKIPEKPRDALSFDEVKKLFPLKYTNAITIWETHRNYTLMLHPLLKQELKATEKYQDKIDKIWE